MLMKLNKREILTLKPRKLETIKEHSLLTPTLKLNPL